MKKILRKIYYKILEITPKKIVVNIENLFTYGRFFKKNRTDYYGEKIQWLKLYGNLECYSKYVDKYAVREYIAKEIGEEYLIPLIGVYDSVDEIDYDKLPEKFVLKLNNGSGCNLIVKDKTKLDIKRTNKQLKRWLKLDYSKIKKEPQYKGVKNKIICEKYVADKNGNLLDYKYFCFNGKPEMIQVDFDRFGKHPKNFYDTKWNLLDIRSKYAGGTYAAYTEKFEAPKNHKKMQDIVEKLCEKFQFVRVDLYNVDGKIYFGELTFTPASGRHPFSPIEEDMRLASKIHINDSSKIKVLMVGPARDVKGGMTTVIDNYYSCGLQDAVELKYIESINDKRVFSKILKEKKGLHLFKKIVKDYDVVHIHMASRRSTFRKIKYIKIASKNNKKIIIHIHGGGFSNFYKDCSDARKQYIKNNLRKADKVIVLSKSLKEYFETIVESQKIVVLRNSIIIPKNVSNDFGSKKFLFLGRINKRKGIYDLVDVFGEIRAKYPDALLYIGGDGPEKKQLQLAIKEKGLSNSIKMIGWVSGDVKKRYLEECQFFILPSYSECMPMSILENMSYGNIVISTKVGGIPELIKDGVDGIIVDAGDKGAMKRRILDILEDINKCRRISIEARKTICENLDAEKITKTLIGVYRNECKK